ncbi:hypothetical protein HanPI659440_Chr15g0600401 [Helianthus annuus]|nr:hypothetical protein HanPI659440_Chr15g0600401 [Helianthus annuus]
MVSLQGNIFSLFLFQIPMNHRSVIETMAVCSTIYRTNPTCHPPTNIKVKIEQIQG